MDMIMLTSESIKLFFHDVRCGQNLSALLEKFMRDRMSQSAGSAHIASSSPGLLANRGKLLLEHHVRSYWLFQVCMAVIASPGLKLKQGITQKKMDNVVFPGLENSLSQFRAFTHVIRVPSTPCTTFG
jgi:hypothetical protein